MATVKCDFKLPQGGCADGICQSGKHSTERTLCCADCKDVCPHRCSQSQPSEKVI